MFTTLKNNWSIIRVLRLLMGILISIQAYELDNYVLLFLGILFTALPLFNLGCGSGSCAIPTKKTKTDYWNV